MKRKLFMFLGIVSCTMFLVGCSAKKTKEENDREKVTEQSVEESDKSTTADEKQEKITNAEQDVENAEDSVDAEASNDLDKEGESIVYESPLGYTCKYDSTVFTLEDTEGVDQFLYQTEEKLESQVYMTVLSYADMDAETLFDGIVLQNNIEKSEVQNTIFGKDGIEAKCAHMETDVNGVKQIYTYYVIPSGHGSLLVEIVGYVGMPEMVEGKLEEITGTFSMNNKG
ncbi:MAG: hypothetical protein SO415_06190 [Oliverpabstia sp.]|nr:hypothetical protein [Oliverpabstia sp.]